MAKQYRLKFRPTPISRLLKRSKCPMPMVGYPRANNWTAYWNANYKFMLAENEADRQKRAAEIEFGQGPFVDDWASAYAS